MTTQVLHTKRINLSPFTKDFRVWGAPIETKLIYLRVTLWVTSSTTAYLQKQIFRVPRVVSESDKLRKKSCIFENVVPLQKLIFHKMAKRTREPHR